MKALFIPVALADPLTYVTVRDLDDVTSYIGGEPEATRYDRDALMLVDGTGRTAGKPLNDRATRYIKTASSAARNHHGRQRDFPTGYGLYGDVVVIGQDLGYDVPARLVEWFETNTDTEWVKPPRAEPAPNLAEDVAEILRAHDFDSPDAIYQPEVLQFARAAERVARALRLYLPEENPEPDCRPPGQGQCPACDSHSPQLHPAVQHGGEVIGRNDPFHGDFRPLPGESLAEFSRRVYGTGPR